MLNPSVGADCRWRQQFNKISQEARIVGVTKSRRERCTDKKQLREAIDELTVDALEARARHYRVPDSQINSAFPAFSNDATTNTKQNLISLILQASAAAASARWRPSEKMSAGNSLAPQRAASTTARRVAPEPPVPRNTSGAVTRAPPQQLTVKLQMKARDGASEVKLVVKSDDDVHETVMHAFGLNGASVWIAERQLGHRGSLEIERPGVRAGSFDDNGVPDGACLIVQEATI